MTKRTLQDFLDAEINENFYVTFPNKSARMHNANRELQQLKTATQVVIPRMSAGWNQLLRDMSNAINNKKETKNGSTQTSKD